MGKRVKPRVEMIAVKPPAIFSSSLLAQFLCSYFPPGSPVITPHTIPLISLAKTFLPETIPNQFGQQDMQTFCLGARWNLTVSNN